MPNDLPPLDPDAGKKMVADHDVAVVQVQHLAKQLRDVEGNIARLQEDRRALVEAIHDCFKRMIVKHEGAVDGPGIGITYMADGSLVYWLPDVPIPAV